MDSFTDKLAVVTGGGSGMGRELVRQLAAEGCSVATCDLNVEAAAQTEALARSDASPGVRVSSHQCDVSDEAEVVRQPGRVAGLQQLRLAVEGEVHRLHGHACLQCHFLQSRGAIAALAEEPIGGLNHTASGFARPLFSGAVSGTRVLLRTRHG